MRKRFYIGLAFSLLSAMIFVACGGGGSPSGGGEPSLGITSIEKMGATAIPNPEFANAGQTGAFLNTIAPFWERKIAYALTTTSSCSISAPTSFQIEGGQICLEEVYVILDQIKFNQSAASITTPDEFEVGPFGLDLLNNDPDPEVKPFIDMTVPSGQYQSIEFRVKRVDDKLPADSQIPSSLVLKIFDRGKKQRPSVWIKGQIEVEVGPGVFEHTPFIFLTDRRWEETIRFKEFDGSDADDAVLALDVEKAFNAALSTGLNASDLKAEVGTFNENTPASEQLGPGFLDGRFLDKSHGTPISIAIADQLPFHMKIFIQKAGGIDTVQAGETLIADSAELVSDETTSPNVIDNPPDP